MNSELIIKTTIWEKENFELVDYLNDDIIINKITINSSGVLCRNNKETYFTPGDNIPKSPNYLLRINKNLEIGKYVIDCGNWSKDLSKLVEEQGIFFVYRGLSFHELSKNYSYRYYKLSQGDIFKIGRMYFKVLDIHLNREGLDLKSNNSIKGTFIRSSSCNSIIVNGQQIIKGEFSNNQNKKPLNKLYYNKINKLNNNNNNSILSKKSNNYKNDSSDFFIQKKNSNLPKINSTPELITIKKVQNKKEKKRKRKLSKKKDLKKFENNINKPACRICYGEESNDENPLICPCICKGSMKYIHYECLKNWLNSKIEEEMPMDNNEKDIESISYNRKDISCELCKEKFPDYIKYKNFYYNISFYKPKFEEFIILESMKIDNDKNKYINIISFDNKFSINIGRSRDCELSIPELSVSRYHCMIHKEEGELFLEDNSSKFGTLVLIQNKNIIMNNFIPLRIQVNQTFIKLKMKNPFFTDCCLCLDFIESKKYDYQLQNRNGFDILSYFIIKDNDSTLNTNNNRQEQEEDIKINNNLIDNSKQLINDNDEKNEIKGEDQLILKQNEILNFSHVNPLVKHIKRINIKKGKNDSIELPELKKIKVDNVKDSISILSDRKKISDIFYNYQQNKQQTNLIKINNNLTLDKTNSRTNNTKNINFNNSILNPQPLNVIKDYTYKK